MDPSCKFLHNKQACQRERALVLEARRISLGRPTTRDISQKYNQDVAELRSSRSQALVPKDFDHFDVEDDPEMVKLWNQRRMIKKICSNPDCLNVKWKKGKSSVATDSKEPEAETDEPAMKRCGRCHATWYCSVRNVYPNDMSYSTHGFLYLITYHQGRMSKGRLETT